MCTVALSHDVAMDVNELVGTFVVEVGVRQAWPFVGFCDHRVTSSRETRLYLDATWSIGGEPERGVDETQQWLTAADDLDGLTVSDATVVSGGALRLEFVGGVVLSVSTTSTLKFSEARWWFSPWHH